MVTQQQAYRLQELGDFLRTRRARLTPEEVGLPRGSRRKTPGLRRAEVAQMVGVSVDWYTWLEQGRSIRPSTQVLERLVQVLRLDVNERNHLFLLAQEQAPPGLPQETETISPVLQRFLDQFGIRPAFVSGRRGEIIAWNAAGCAVFGDYRKRTPRERTPIWNIFTNPASREYIVDWEDDAREHVARFRNICASYPDDPQLNDMIRDLQLISPEFRVWWQEHEVRSGQEGRKTLNLPGVGYLHLERLIFQVFESPDLKVTVYSPLEDGETPRKLEHLLEQWQRQETPGRIPSKPAVSAIPLTPSPHDTVGLWLADCGQRAETAWTANSAIMTSYATWCEAHGHAPKKAKGVSQALAGRGFAIGVNKRVVDENGQQKMARGVRGLAIC